MTYAAFWKRFVALVIDSICINIISFILGFITGMVLGIAGNAAGMARDTIMQAAGAAGYAEGIIVFFLYYSLFESSAKQATIGKMALGVKVTDTEGNRLSFGKALLRAFGKLISLIIFGLGCLVAAFTEKKQALHDFIAKTLVVNA